MGGTAYTYLEFLSTWLSYPNYENKTFQAYH